LNPCCLSLGKEIDFWRERSSSLASQLAETGKTYDSKLEHVLVAQESLSEQQQQVLRELSAALAAQQALAAAATAGATGSGSPGTGASNPVPPVLSPEQVCLSSVCLVILVSGPETVRFVRMTKRKICIALLTIPLMRRRLLHTLIMSHRSREMYVGSRERPAVASEH
jgi:uncharacterized coiled-coil protein SlyX